MRTRSLCISPRQGDYILRDPDSVCLPAGDCRRSLRRRGWHPERGGRISRVGGFPRVIALAKEFLLFDDDDEEQTVWVPKRDVQREDAFCVLRDEPVSQP